MGNVKTEFHFFGLHIEALDGCILKDLRVSNSEEGYHIYAVAVFPDGRKGRSNGYGETLEEAALNWWTNLASRMGFQMAL